MDDHVVNRIQFSETSEVLPIIYVLFLSVKNFLVE